MRTTTIILILVLLCCVVGMAKKPGFSNIQGTITEKGRKLPITGIEVGLFQDGKTIAMQTTDEAGLYKFSKLSPGQYVLKITSDYYEPFSKAITLRSSCTKKLNIRLIAAVRGEIIKDSNQSQVVNADQVGSGVTAYESKIYTYSSPSAYTQPQVFMPPYIPPASTEDYSPITPNIFQSPLTDPLSTFSIDVDTATYSNIRRMLNQNVLPEPNSIRIEELLNYFSYNYPQPDSEHPFSVYSEAGVVPWNQKRSYVHIGIQGKKLNLSAAPPSNLVFLIDVSGSMDAPNKLQLVQEALSLLIENLRGNDKVAIVVYAGAAGEVLPSTNGNSKLQIRNALTNLRAGGSTAGGAGIQLAYKIAQESIIPGGNNRIILCTDGDFNVGASSDAHLTELVESNRNKGIYLTVLGFGMGNYKDNKLELIANKGNGNYAYIDTINEAKKVLVNEMVSTLYTIAKDVKLQVEFNPAHVKAYRLVGYENRLLRDEDFKDDSKDAGELGAGHTVTAIYEIIPTNSKESVPELDPLKYQNLAISEEAKNSPEMMTVKLRYKLPDSDVSTGFEVPIMNKFNALDASSETYLFSSAVVGFGLMLQDSEFKEALTWETVKDLATKSIGKDSDGYRAEFIELIDKAAKLHTKKMQEENRDFNKSY